MAKKAKLKQIHEDKRFMGKTHNLFFAIQNICQIAFHDKSLQGETMITPRQIMENIIYLFAMNVIYVLVG